MCVAGYAPCSSSTTRSCRGRSIMSSKEAPEARSGKAFVKSFRCSNHAQRSIDSINATPCCCFLDLFAIFWRGQLNRADRLDASILASYCWYRITFTYISGRCISAPEPARFPLSFLAFVSCCLNDQDSHKCFSRMYTCVRSPADAISQKDWNPKK